MFIIIGNVLSLFGNFANFLSTRCKTKKNTLLFQSLEVFIYTVADLFLGGYSGAIINISGIPKFLYIAYSKTNNLFINLLLTIPGIIISLYLKEPYWYGILPILSVIFYSLIIMFFNDIKIIKMGLIINTLIWMLYALCINDYISVLFKMFITLPSLFQSYISIKNSINKNEV